MSTTPAAQSDDLNQVIPTVKTMTVGGESIAIKQFEVGRLPSVLLAIQPVSHILINRAPGEKLDLPSMFIMYANDSLALLSVLANKPRDWVNALELDDAIDLFAELLEVNLDFFVKKVLPKLGGVVGRLANTAKENAQELQALGQMASNYSSNTAITTTTS